MKPNWITISVTHIACRFFYLMNYKEHNSVHISGLSERDDKFFKLGIPQCIGIWKIKTKL